MSIIGESCVAVEGRTNTLYDEVTKQSEMLSKAEFQADAIMNFICLEETNSNELHDSSGPADLISNIQNNNYTISRILSVLDKIYSILGVGK